MARSETRGYEDLPRRDGLPVLGNTLEFYGGIIPFEEACRELGDVVGFSLLDKRGVVVAEPEAVKQVLVTKQDRFTKGAFTRDMFDDTGVGLFVEQGEAWAERRRLLQPAFRPDYIEAYRDRILRSTERVADGLAAADRVAMDERMKELSLSVLAATLFGVDREDALRDRIAEAVPPILRRMDTASLNTVLPAWVPTRRNRRFRAALSELHGIIDGLLDRRQGGDDSHDLVSIFADALADGKLDRETVRADMVTFTIAGHDTTALTLTYALYLLASHPDVAARLRAELDETLGGDPPTFDGFDELPVLDRVIRETMRLYPVATNIARETTEPVEVGGYRLPAGVTVLCSQWLLHHDERYFEDPWTFRPSRWRDDADGIPEYAYFPFGGGPRHCIGMRFATAELTLALAVLCQRFTFEPVGEFPELSVAITLQPDDPVELAVSER